MRRCSGFLSMRRFLCCFLSVEFFLFPPSGVFPSLHPVARCCWWGGIKAWSLAVLMYRLRVCVCVLFVCLLACLCFFARVRFLAAWRPFARTRVSSTRFFRIPRRLSRRDGRNAARGEQQPERWRFSHRLRLAVGERGRRARWEEGGRRGGIDEGGWGGAQSKKSWRQRHRVCDAADVLD